MPSGKPGTNYCKDCRWADPNAWMVKHDPSKAMDYARCRHPKLSSPLSSEGAPGALYCSTQRMDIWGWTRFIFFEKECGTPGRYWEPKP